METTPITGLDELDQHLDDLLHDASLTLNAKLFDDVELQLTETNIPPLIPRFLPRLTSLLKQYPQDPAIIVSLTVMLLGPLPFDHVFSIAESDDLTEALDSPAASANLLVLSILHKATLPRHISFFCMDTSLVSAFIRRWLASPQVEVGQKAGRVLGDLLDIDCPLPPPPPPTRPVDASHADLTLRKAPGHGTLWNLLFNDPRFYTLLLDLIAGRHPDTAGDPHQLSLAQGRVLRLLPRLAAINFRAVSHSHMTAPTPVHFTNGDGHGNGNGQSTDSEGQPPPPSNPNPNPPRPGEGLLQYAALRMVQKSDTLMHLSLVDFFETLVSLLRVTEDSALKTETLRAMLGEATAGDTVLRDALLSLPERTVEVEAEDLRRWLGEVMPGETVGLAVR